MDTLPTAATGQANAARSPGPAARDEAAPGSGDPQGLNGNAALAGDFNTFLRLLTTQLQEQDPLEPMKTQEFTNQLVQFAGVEQQIKSNDKLGELIALQDEGKASAAVGFLGKRVEAAGESLVLQDGNATFGIDLDSAAETATVTIADATGQPVRTLEVPTGAGRHTVAWDGTDGNGQSVPDGVYTVSLTAVDAGNATVTGETTTIGRVTGFEQQGGEMLLNLGGVEVALDDVRAVRAPESDPNGESG